MSARDALLVKEVEFLTQVQARFRQYYPKDKKIDLATLLELLPCQGTSQGGAPACSGFVFDFHQPKGSSPLSIPCACRWAVQALLPLERSGLLDLECSSATILETKFSDCPTLAWQKLPDGVHVDSVVFRQLYTVSQCRKSAEASSRTERWTTLPMSESVEASTRFLLRLADLGDVAATPNYQFLSWHKLKAMYATAGERTSSTKGAQATLRQAFLDEVGHRRVILLSLGKTQFRVRSGSNVELGAFEFFLDDIARTHCGLVVWSTQPLIFTPPQVGSPVNPAALRYTGFGRVGAERESFRDGEAKLRFATAKLPVGQPLPLQLVLRAGSFDRLVELLARGQAYLESELSFGPPVMP